MYARIMLCILDTNGRADLTPVASWLFVARVPCVGELLELEDCLAREPSDPRQTYVPKLWGAQEYNPPRFNSGEATEAGWSRWKVVGVQHRARGSLTIGDAFDAAIFVQPTGSADRWPKP